MQLEALQQDNFRFEPIVLAILHLYLPKMLVDPFCATKNRPITNEADNWSTFINVLQRLTCMNLAQALNLITSLYAHQNMVNESHVHKCQRHKTYIVCWENGFRVALAKQEMQVLRLRHQSILKFVNMIFPSSATSSPPATHHTNCHQLSFAETIADKYLSASSD